MEICSGWEGLGGGHGFVTLLPHSRKVQSCLSLCHRPASPLPVLHLERQNFARRGGRKHHYSTLTSWQRPYQITAFSALELLSYGIKRCVSSLLVQCGIFTLAEQFPMVGSQLILKAAFQHCSARPQERASETTEDRLTLGNPWQQWKPLLPTKQPILITVLLSESCLLCQQVVAYSRTLFTALAAWVSYETPTAAKKRKHEWSTQVTKPTVDIGLLVM